MTRMQNDRDRASSAPPEEIATLLYHSAPGVLLSLLDNPAFDETHLLLLLARKNLPLEILEEVSRRKVILKSYRVKRALMFHPRTPRLVALRLLRDLYLMDLAQVTLLPGVSAELKRHAEQQLATRLPHLPLGQKITLARRGPARVASELLAEGHQRVLPVALENPSLTEAQILRVLASHALPGAVVQAIAQHRKWSTYYNIRLALVRHPASTLATVLAFLPDLTVSDLRELVAPGIVSENLRKYLQAEVQRRIRFTEKS
ncbi:MAG: hypothetical protein NVS9B4_24590 [Candidatus Acidiferrum sp.]